MSKYASQQIDDRDKSDTLGADFPEGQVQDDSYITSSKQPIPVQRDNAPVEGLIEASSADTDQQLNKGDKVAINESNIISDKTRGSKPRGSYEEPGDELPGLE